MRSSYIENNYGEVLYSYVVTYPPVLAVELGVLDGYSLLYIAKGIKKNGIGHLDAYDLFEDYQFKHGNKEEIEEIVAKEGLSSQVSLFKADAYKVSEKYDDSSVHLLHVDVSNTGETVRRVMEQWDRKMVHGGFIIFEGGSEERDRIEWMIKYNKEPMKPEIEKNPIINSKYIYGTHLKYPSITVLLKRG